MCHDFCSDRPQSSHSQRASTATKPNGGMALLAVPEEYPPSPHEAQQILAEESWEARCQEAPAWEGPKDPKNPKGMGVWSRSP